MSKIIDNLAIAEYITEQFMSGKCIEDITKHHNIPNIHETEEIIAYVLTRSKIKVIKKLIKKAIRSEEYIDLFGKI